MDARTVSGVRMRPGRVLLVEDSSDERGMYARHLRDAGWEVCEVASGAEAVVAAIEFRPDVVVTDLNMPGLDGVAVARLMKLSPLMRDVAVIVVSAYVTRSWEAYAAGCHTFLTKPCLPDTLVEILGGLQNQGFGREK